MVKECMENAVLLNVPLQVKLSIGKTWGSLQTYSPPSNTSSGRSFLVHHTNMTDINMELNKVKVNDKDNNISGMNTTIPASFNTTHNHNNNTNVNEMCIDTINTETTSIISNIQIHSSEPIARAIFGKNSD